METPKNNKATDKRCCGEWTGKESYECDRDGARTKPFTCRCECHQAPTPSLSEGEGWDESFDREFSHVGWIPSHKKHIKAFIRILLSQTLSKERQRMVAIGEELKSGLNEHNLVDEGFLEAIEIYQQKIKSLK